MAAIQTKVATQIEAVTQVATRIKTQIAIRTKLTMQIVTKSATKTATKKIASLASGLPRGMTMVVGVACLISLGACRSRIADPEMPEWDDASIEAVLKKPNLKVLDIGNSYTKDATASLPTVVKNSGADVKELCLL